MSQVQGVCLRSCKFTLQAQEEERETSGGTEKLEGFQVEQRCRRVAEISGRIEKGISRIVEVSKGEFTLSVQRSRGLAEVPKLKKSSIVEEKTGGRQSRNSGIGNSKGSTRANKDLREVVKSGLILDHWIHRTRGREPRSLGKSRREYSRGHAKSELVKNK
jgi:hypothetical protein